MYLCMYDTVRRHTIAGIERVLKKTDTVPAQCSTRNQKIKNSYTVMLVRLVVLFGAAKRVSEQYFNLNILQLLTTNPSTVNADPMVQATL